MMPPNLGRLQPVDLRCEWPSEAGDFTPWLAHETNLALLGGAFGGVEAQKCTVGPAVCGHYWKIRSSMKERGRPGGPFRDRGSAGAIRRPGCPPRPKGGVAGFAGFAGFAGRYRDLAQVIGRRIEAQRIGHLRLAGRHASHRRCPAPTSRTPGTETRTGRIFPLRRRWVLYISRVTQWTRA